MTAANGSEIPVEAPHLVPPLTGLLAQLGTVSGPEADRWLRGLAFSPDPSQSLEGNSSVCAPTALGNNDLITRAGLRQALPFELILRERCSTWGYTQNNYVERATRGLDVKRHNGVEREFEQGALAASNLHLAATYTAPDPTTVTLASGVAVSPVNALALLDEAIASAAIGRGIIHATAFVIDQWRSHGLLNTEMIEGDEGLGVRTSLYSPKGNLVIAGNGYEGRGPDGTVPASHASQWAYATDWIVVVEGTPTTIPDTLEEATDRSRNQVVYAQHQWFAVLWAGLLHAAVLVATDTPAGGGGGGGPTSAVTIADGADVAQGTTSDLATANTVIGRLKKLISLLPTALGALGGLKVEPVAPTTGAHTNVANSITSVTVLAANAARKGATIFNDDTAVTGATLRIKFGATASATSFLYAIPPQGYYEVPFGYTGIIDGIASAATGTARVEELT